MKKNFGTMVGAMLVAVGIIVAYAVLEGPLWMACIGFLVGLTVAVLGFELMFKCRDSDIMHKFDDDNYRDMED